MSTAANVQLTKKMLTITFLTVLVEINLINHVSRGCDSVVGSRQ